MCNKFCAASRIWQEHLSRQRGEQGEQTDWQVACPQSSSLKMRKERLWRTARWRKGTTERGPASDWQTSQSLIVLTNKLRLITFLSMHMAHRTTGQNKKESQLLERYHYPYTQSSLGLYRRLVPGPPVDTKISGCSRPLYKMPKYLHVTEHVLHNTSKSPIQWKYW